MDGRHQAPSPRLPEELDRARPAVSSPHARGIARAQALQRSAGNRSVSVLLARAPDDPKPGDKPKSEQKGGGAGTATLPDIGTIPLTSASLGASRGPGAAGPGPDSREGRAPVRQEIVFTSIVGEHSPKLFKALSDGRQMAVEVVMGSSFHLSLVGAIVSSYSSSPDHGEGPAESWTLNFESFTQS